MNCPDSFDDLYGKDLWQPFESPYDNYGGHAMCVAGYDDDKYGGAFAGNEQQGNFKANGIDGEYIISSNVLVNIYENSSGFPDIFVRGSIKKYFAE